MYKTKLQEVCHKMQWGLPKYAVMRDGPDHIPSFKASVFLNGLSFDSCESCRSSKEAQNDAAKKAFLHFNSHSLPSSSTIPESLCVGLETNETIQELIKQPNISAPKSGSLISSDEPYSWGQDVQAASGGFDIRACTSFLKDVPLDYKRHLHNYALWKKCDLPIYSNACEGPSHAPCFRATVTVDGHTFESSGFFNTLREAERAAAKAALMSLSNDGFLEDYSGFYKNLLQELAQRECLSMPVYKLIKSGAPHMPTFFSHVKIGGEKFYGMVGKSKKEAEMKAAKIACTVLMDRALNRNAESAYSNLAADETLNSAPGSDASVHFQHHLKQNGEQLPSPVITNEEYSAENEDEVPPKKLADSIPVNSIIGSDGPILSFSPRIPMMDVVIGNQETSSPYEPVTSSSSSIYKRKSSSTSPISDSNKGNATGPSTYLLCNRFRVYRCYPDIAFPKDISVMPIGDNQWVAVSLEFPMEQGH